jgi:hypothetical protein
MDNIGALPGIFDPVSITAISLFCRQGQSLSTIFFIFFWNGVLNEHCTFTAVSQLVVY